MKRLFRYAFPLMLAVIMMAAMSQAVLAETVKGTVTYTDGDLDLAYSTAEIEEQLKSLTPGDEVDLEFELVNDSGDETDWYVEDSVVRAFEEGSAAEDGTYTYKLTYTSGSGGSTEIYSSDVGGSDAGTTMPKGLKQATSGDDEYYYLDRIAPGGEGTLTLAIAIDGETLGNDYQSTLADLNVSFAVEVPDSDEPATTTKSTNTGDSTHLMIYVALFLTAALLLVLTMIYARRSRAKGGSNEE